MIERTISKFETNGRIKIAIKKIMTIIEMTKWIFLIVAFAESV